MRGITLRGKQWARARQIRVVLTMAHLNHISGDDKDENLKMLCQWCHLNYDRLHHHQTRSTRKDARRPILTEVA
jgi:5-methylcytosine-specific restriction endonuclease McrA